MNEGLAADLQADFNIAYVHWGGEYTPQEIKEQVTLANSLSTRGYEFVIGSGPSLSTAITEPFAISPVVPIG